MERITARKAGAAKILEQSQFTADAVASLLGQWDRNELLSMAEKAHSCAITDATERVAAVICEVAK